MSYVNFRAPESIVSDFIPIEPLSRPDADTMLVFLSGNGIEFLKPTTDPWYRATVKSGHAYFHFENETTDLYRPEVAASPLGCVQQSQFCNPSLPQETRCGPLASHYDSMLGSAAQFNLTEEEINSPEFPSHRTGSRFAWLTMQLQFAVVPFEVILSTLGARALESQNYLEFGLMGELPENQWQRDISQLFSIYLSSIQTGVVSAALGPSDPALDPYKITPPNKYIRELCKSQVRVHYHPRTLGFSNIQAELIFLLDYRKSSAHNIYPSVFLDFILPTLRG